jgi:hypothetical protein
MEDDQLLQALENIRRDKHDPWRYMLFTLMNGIAQGLGMALGMTVVLGLVILILSQMISRMIDMPVVGYYFGELGKLIDAYSKAAPKIQ